MKQTQNSVNILKGKKKLVDSISKTINLNNSEIREPEVSIIQKNNNLQESRGLIFESVKKNFIGLWQIDKYKIDGVDYISAFIDNKFPETSIDNLQFKVLYEFKENVCLKTMDISFDYSLNDEWIPFVYSIKVVFSYRLVSNDSFMAMVELGYITHQDGDEKIFKGIDATKEEVQIQFSFKDSRLLLMEKATNDYKELIRVVK